MGLRLANTGPRETAADRSSQVIGLSPSETLS